MRILMMTNTYLPHVGGVARSVETFTEEYRRRGHEVLVVAPEFPDMPEHEEGVIRLPAIQKFNGSDFSVRLPIPGFLGPAISEFDPQVVHSHHPFLLGDTAQRVAALWNIPLVFTHHTMYERYTHYVPGDSPTLRRFVVELVTHYANLCDRVVAPSESIASVLRRRGVDTPIEVIATGVDVQKYSRGNGRAARERYGLPEEAFVVGHVGRLAPEKNLPFLAKSASLMLRRHPKAFLLVVGTGPSADDIREECRRAKVENRLKLVGSLQGQELVDAYHAMDVFAFASTSETQGMVLVEAMAAGVPVVALDAPGAREVVVDGRNGRLLTTADPRTFAEGLVWVAQHKSRSDLEHAALAMADRYSTDRCVEKALAMYESVINIDPRQPPHEAVEDLYPWESALKLIEKEYRLWENRASAVTTAMQGEFLVKMPFVRWIRRYWRLLMRVLSRNEWAANLLNLPRSQGTEVSPGLLMIQIDGLAQTQLLRALEHRSMPYLQRLLDREGYKLHTFYSGLPSSTPAVQGELFYGVRSAVPAFGFRDGRSGALVSMIDQQVALKVQQRLATQGEGLLAEGSCYSNIYSGGAAEPHFCAVNLGWGSFLQAAHPLSLLAFLLMRAVSALRIVWLTMIELVLALIDFVRGLYEGRSLGHELRFIPTRVGICVLMREMILSGASVDVTRGLPVVHANLLGYDEQSHRRGPSSAFAHWALKGIDKTIERIAKAAHASRHRDYVVWIYSDHGQEEAESYVRLHGEDVDKVVAEVLEPHLAQLGWQRGEGSSQASDTRSEGHQRSRWLGQSLHKVTAVNPEQPRVQHDRVAVAAMGPIGHVYLPPHPGNFDFERLEKMATDLVGLAHIPCVLAQHDGRVWAWTNEGRIKLPEESARFLGEDHPFLKEVTADLIALCQHPDAGDFVISGWRKEGKPITFPRERGAHAGPGREETRAFALLPAEVNVDKGYLRPEDLRQLAFEVFNPPYRPAQSRPPATIRVHEPEERAEEHRGESSREERVVTRSVRILTYNVHSCIGLDGKLSPKRIARVIARCGADIVALQEVDVGRRMSGGLDQAHLIAHELEMEHHFHAAWEVEEERYGNAVLSRFPLELVQAKVLPTVVRRRGVEPRGAILVEVDLGGTCLHLINTHLGLSQRERDLQVAALLGDEWLARADCTGPWVMCGDFNMPPGSATYKMICGLLHDTQMTVAKGRPQPTWPGTYPWRRLDYVFASHDIETTGAQVLRSQLTQVASDHLPLVTELRIPVAVIPRGPRQEAAS